MANIEAPDNFELEYKRLPPDKFAATITCTARIEYRKYIKLDLWNLPHWVVSRVADKYGMPPTWRWIVSIGYDFENRQMVAIVKEH